MVVEDTWAPMCVDMWRYVNMVAEMLDDYSLPNLFKEENVNPTANLLADMVKQHRLRSTYDFELAINRVMKGRW